MIERIISRKSLSHAFYARSRVNALSGQVGLYNLRSFHRVVTLYVITAATPNGLIGIVAGVRLKMQPISRQQKTCVHSFFQKIIENEPTKELSSHGQHQVMSVDSIRF